MLDCNRKTMIVPDGIILSISGKSITIEERNFFKKIKPLGFVLFF